VQINHASDRGGFYLDKISELKSHLNNYIFETLKEESFKQTFNELLMKEFKNVLILKREGLLADESYRVIKNSIKINLYKIFKSQSFKNEIIGFVESNLKSLETSNNTLENIVSPAVVNGIKVYIYNNKDELVKTLKQFISSDSVEKKIYEEVNSVLKGINPMVSRFVSTSTILEKLKTGISDFLDNPKNIMDIVNMINGQIDVIMKKRVSEFAAYFPVESRSSLSSSISNGILNNLASEKFIDMVIYRLEEILLSALDSMNDKDENSFNGFDSVLCDLINVLYDKVMASDKAAELVSALSDNIIDKLLNKPLIRFIEA
jgi:hypothetical protein